MSASFFRPIAIVVVRTVACSVADLFGCSQVSQSHEAHKRIMKNVEFDMTPAKFWM